MDGIRPSNLAAQLEYRGVGNPPNSHPRTAISNCFPGLEFDFRNVWRRIFVGLQLHESSNLVVAVEEGAAEPLRPLQGHSLLALDGEPVVTTVVGPRAPDGRLTFPQPDGPTVTLESATAMEWSNVLAPILSRAGSTVRGTFLSPDGERLLEVDLTVRPFFDGDPQSPRAVIARDLAGPGDLTQSLCSPWQNDYRECACYYWAASRPDYVNVETGTDGQSRGHNWLHKDRDANTPHQYSLNPGDLLTYEDLFKNWERDLKFEVDGKDSE